MLDWVENYDMHPIDIIDVERAVSKTIVDTKDYFINRACMLDASDELFRDKVSIREIVNTISLLSDDEGRVKKGEIIKFTVDSERHFRQKRLENFHTKLNQLKDIGFVIEDGKYLIGIPRMFFYKKKK
jgi:hypothetical protein